MLVCVVEVDVGIMVGSVLALVMVQWLVMIWHLKLLRLQLEMVLVHEWV